MQLAKNNITVINNYYIKDEVETVKRLLSC